MKIPKLVKPYSGKGKAKYHAIRCEEDGHRFDSQMERDYYLHLKSKGIPAVPHPKKVELLPGISWNLDFRAEGPDGHYYVDVKGYPTREYLLKKKLWALFGPTALHIVTKVPDPGNPWRTTVVPPGRMVWVDSEPPS